MKTLLNQKWLILFVTGIISFSFLNFKCTDITKSPTTSQPNPNNTDKSVVAYIEVFNLLASKSAYDDCVDRQGNCAVEKKAMLANQQSVSAIFGGIPPLPWPSPCTPTGNCNNLYALDHLIYPENESYLVSIFDANSGQLLGRSDPRNTMESKLVKGYVNSANKKFVKQFSGLAKVEIKNAITSEVGSFEMKMDHR